MKKVLGAIVIIGALVGVGLLSKQPSKSPLLFTEVGKSLGLHHIQHNYNKLSPSDLETNYERENLMMSGGVAVGDVNDDGWMDLYFTRPYDTGVLYINEEGENFADRTNKWGLGEITGSNGAVFADLDHDGDQDLYITTIGSNQNYLMINNGASFADESAERGAALVGETNHHSYGISLGDINRDGFTDILTNNWIDDDVEDPENFTRLLQNDGVGNFTDITESAGLDTSGVFAFSSAMVDLDGDTWQDIIIIGDFGTTQLYWNNGNGTFSLHMDDDFGTEENGMGLAIDDIDGDGDQDIFVSSIFDPNQSCDNTNQCIWGNSGNRLYRSNGDRSFTDATDQFDVRDSGWGWGSTFADLDSSGINELLSTSGMFAVSDPSTGFSPTDFSGDSMHVWSLLKDFPRDTKEFGLYSKQGRGIAALDFDNDGDLDVVVVQNGAEPLLFRNNSNPDNWAAITLETTENIFGAFLAASYADDTTKTKILHGNDNFLGHNDPRIIFPKNAAIQSIDILYPDGTKSSIEQPLAREYN